MDTNEKTKETESHVKNINELHANQLTFGEKVADKMADFAGSWTFIISFIVILLTWISLNSWVVLFKPYDPYPFILLNLVLSYIAALQAPIIMMSQKRQESKDRLRSEQDYKVDVKAAHLIETILMELEIVKQQQDLLLKQLSEKHDDHA